MKNIRLPLLLSLAIVLLVLFIKSTNPVVLAPIEIPLPSPTATPDARVLEFEGTLTDFDERCAVDAQCKAFVNGYEIIVNPGFVIDRSVIGESNVWVEDIGKTVKVRALKVSDGVLTIVGSLDYYVLVKE